MDAEDTDRNLQWELGNALAVVEQLIDDLPEDRREQCLTAARRAAAELDAVAADLPRQVIHGDLTADNVMRDRRGRHWVIDLGDVATSWRAAELAMLLADLMGRTDDLAIVARAVAGFDQRARLTDAEIEALWPSSCCAERCSPSAGGASCASTRATTTRASGSSTNGRSSRARRGCRPPR
jgi:Ser/Thr protein kinase RdoA (MazF antagonist)